MPEGTLKALAEHGDVSATIPEDGGNSEEALARFADAKIDVHALSRQLQDEGAKSFVKSWNALMGVISSNSAAITRASARGEKRASGAPAEDRATTSSWLCRDVLGKESVGRRCGRNLGQDPRHRTKRGALISIRSDVDPKADGVRSEEARPRLDI